MGHLFEIQYPMKFDPPLEIGWINERPLRRALTPEERQLLIKQLTNKRTRARWVAAMWNGKLKVREGLEPLIVSLKDPQLAG